MRLLPLLIVTLLLPTCTTASLTPSGEGLCLSLAPLADDLASALEGPGVPDPALIKGTRLVAGIDAGCNP